MSRAKGTPKTGGRPSTKRELTCPECGQAFWEVPSKKQEGACCTRACAFKRRERMKGHQPAIIAKCGLLTCDKMVKRYASQNVSKTTKNPTGNVYCSDDHFQEARRQRQNKRRARNTVGGKRL